MFSKLLPTLWHFWLCINLNPHHAWTMIFLELWAYLIVLLEVFYSDWLFCVLLSPALALCLRFFPCGTSLRVCGFVIGSALIFLIIRTHCTNSISPTIWLISIKSALPNLQLSFPQSSCSSPSPPQPCVLVHFHCSLSIASTGTGSHPINPTNNDSWCWFWLAGSPNVGHLSSAFCQCEPTLQYQDPSRCALPAARTSRAQMDLIVSNWIHGTVSWHDFWKCPPPCFYSVCVVSIMRAGTWAILQFLSWGRLVHQENQC